jgi:hypothetical protein
MKPWEKYGSISKALTKIGRMTRLRPTGKTKTAWNLI